MTKYEEIDIENMTQADIRNIILEGDRISIEVEGVEGVLVRTVEQCLNGLRVKLYGVAIIQIRHFSDYGIGMTVTRIERPVPEELPTVPGYYVPSENLSETCPRVYGLGISRWWHSSVNGKVTEERMRELMPLIRLVPETAPAKLADRIDVEKLVALFRRNASSTTGYYGDAEDLIAAIDNGELDK